MRKAAFTLVELLVVIAIIGILIALLLPAIQSARESGRRAQCMNNLRQLSLACVAYCDAEGQFPAGMTTPVTEDPSTTINFGPNWVIRILPFMEFNDLYNQFDLTKYISDPSSTKNIATKAQSLNTMLCPSDSFYNSKPYIPGTSRAAMGTTPWARGNYAANSSIQYLDSPAGDGDNPDGKDPEFEKGFGADGWQLKFQRGVMGCNVGSAPKDIDDGQATTCLLAEVRAGVAPIDHRGTWALGECGGSTLWGHGMRDAAGVNNPSAKSDDLYEGTEIVSLLSEEWLTDQRMSVDEGGNSWQAGCRSQHMGGANIAMCDASVHFISDNIASNSPTGAINMSDLADTMQVWERLMGSGDGLIIDGNSW